MIGNADGEVDENEKSFLHGCLECMDITFDDLKKISSSHFVYVVHKIFKKINKKKLNFSVNLPQIFFLFFFYYF